MQDIKLINTTQRSLVFPKQHRLLIPDDFQRVFKQGRKQRGALFTLYCCANGKMNARLGVAVAKRHVPSAVNRNRVRRLIRESFRYHQSELSGNDVVVIMQRQLPELSNAKLQEELTQAMAKINEFFALFLLGGVHFYRWMISPMLGNRCRFYPSCSQYALDAIEKHGALYGSYLTIKRLSKCHPFHEGGVDLLPTSKQD